MNTISGLKIQTIENGTRWYEASLHLRDRILRKPLGLSLFDEDLAHEKQDVVIGAWIHTELAGVLLLKKSADHTMKMRQVAVEPSLQGRHIGSGMVRFAEAYCIENNIHLITLHARQTVIDFYKKLGYETIEDPFFEIGILHVEMIKHLQSNE